MIRDRRNPCPTTMTPSLTVRRTADTDAERIRHLRIASLTDAPHAFGAHLEDVLAQPHDVFEKIAQGHSASKVSTSFLAFSDAEPIGTIGAFFEGPEHKRAFVCAFWVAPSVRGSGAARMLLDTAVQWLTSQGARSIFAWVADSNSRAWAFYRQQGFVATDETQALPSNPAESETLIRLDTDAG